MTSRRHAGQGMLRRGARGGDGRIVQTYQSILGPLLVEMWHSQLGIALASGAVDTWTGQIGGRVLQAPAAAQRPVYGVDGSAFGGKTVVQCAVTDAKGLRGTGMTSLAAAGSMPCCFVRARHRTTGINRRLVDTYNGTTVIRSLTHYMTAGTLWGATNTTTSNVSVAGTSNTNVHGSACWADGTLLHVRVDGTEATTGDTFALDGSITSLSVGFLNSDAVSSPSDASVALVLWMSAYPGASVIAQLEQLAAAEFPA